MIVSALAKRYFVTAEIESESHVEVTVSVLTKIGIVGSHYLELTKGIHTAELVMILWSIEELFQLEIYGRKAITKRRSKKR